MTLTTPTLQSIKVAVKLLEGVFIGGSLAREVGKEVRVHGKVEWTQSTKSFRGGDVTNIELVALEIVVQSTAES